MAVWLIPEKVAVVRVQAGAQSAALGGPDRSKDDVQPRDVRLTELVRVGVRVRDRVRVRVGVGVGVGAGVKVRVRAKSY